MSIYATPQWVDDLAQCRFYHAMDLPEVWHVGCEAGDVEEGCYGAGGDGDGGGVGQVAGVVLVAAADGDVAEVNRLNGCDTLTQTFHRLIDQVTP